MNISSITKGLAGLVIGTGFLLATATAYATPISVTHNGGTDAFGTVLTDANGRVTLDLLLDVQSLVSPDIVAGYGFSFDTGSGLDVNLVGFNTSFDSYGAGLGLDEVFLSPFSLPFGTTVSPTGPDLYLATLEITNMTSGVLNLGIDGALALLFEGIPSFNLNLSIGAGTNPVPEPGTWALMATGLILLMAWQRRRATEMPTIA